MTRRLPYGETVVRIRSTRTVDAYDQIETVYGTFDVDGEPAKWRSPFTGREGMTVSLRRIEG